MDLKKSTFIMDNNLVLVQDLSEAIVEAMLTGAELLGADLSGIYLDNVKGFSQDQLDMTCTTKDGHPHLGRPRSEKSFLRWHGRDCEYE